MSRAWFATVIVSLTGASVLFWAWICVNLSDALGIPIILVAFSAGLSLIGLVATSLGIAWILRIRARRRAQRRDAPDLPAARVVSAAVTDRRPPSNPHRRPPR